MDSAINAIEQYAKYKTIIKANTETLYENNMDFNELTWFLMRETELFNSLIALRQDLEKIWNTKGQMGILDKYRKIAGILVYGVDNYYPLQKYNMEIPDTAKLPPLVVKRIGKDNIVEFIEIKKK